MKRRESIPKATRPVSRLHAKNPAAAAWRSKRANTYATIEGMSRDPKADLLIKEMDAESIDYADQRRRLIAYFKARDLQKPRGP
ncbi:MAG: hypothetical protein WCD20_08335 [Rhodomicrobium sp.]